MSLSTIAEEASSKDDNYVQSVNMESPAPHMQPYQRTFGSPAILGLISWGTVFLCLSILTLASGSVNPPSLVVVIATLSVPIYTNDPGFDMVISSNGGISQIIVGIWEMFLGHTFSATVFATYGGFNFSYGVLCLPRTGLAAAFTVDGVVGKQFYNAIGIYLAIWGSIAFLLLLGALRTITPFVATNASTVCALTCLSLSAITGNPYLAIASGALGIVASFSAYYSAFSLFWTQRTSFSFPFPFIRFPLIMAPFNV
ncbi:GPR1/FUN34/yaaH family-domain-containing protein [Suillus placidus]|uniref:GPR1/FUN34/yaaH family-domain-containing protein n=1 Tax=Suillus placidus TaxID=48579 RepID=A0A9P6ZNA5_9AGAM|nr:GPR1/FUN34/yaaH family-domain-containing protein [Suillus placidus]